MFMLWWAWLGFNCGSTFGVSGDLWKITALVSVTTLNGAIGGGVTGLVLSMALHKGRVLVDYVINSVLGGLVAITGVAAVTTPQEAVGIGAIGGIIAISGCKVTEKMGIDDPVGAIAVHFFTGIWGTLVVGIFAKENPLGTLRGASGFLHGGGWYLFVVQLSGLLIIVLWSVTTTFIMLVIIDKTSGLRMSEEEELLGADWVEHQIRSEPVASRLEQALLRIDEQHWNKFVQRLYDEVTTHETQPYSRGHRVFSIDQGADAEARLAIRDMQTIIDITHQPTIDEGTEANHIASGKIKVRRGPRAGMYSRMVGKARITPIRRSAATFNLTSTSTLSGDSGHFT